MPTKSKKISQIDIGPSSSRAISRVRTSCSGHTFFGDVWYPPGGTLGPRIQRDFQLVVLVSGHADVLVNEEWVHVAMGEAALLKPKRRETFRFTPSGPTHHTWCAVDPSAIADSIIPELEASPPKVSMSSSMEHLLEAGLSTLARGEAGRNMLDHVAMAVLHEYLRLGSNSVEFDCSGIVPPSMDRARRLMDEEFSRRWSMADLGRTVHVSPNHLIREFRRHYGITPARYLWRRRTEAAAQLLRSTGLSIAEISDRTGFQNPYHFSRVFRSHHGLTPRDFRGRAMNETRRLLRPGGDDD
jgi:AraC-like DNA-binding protein